jgi:hypothetical protein
MSTSVSPHHGNGFLPATPVHPDVPPEASPSANGPTGHDAQGRFTKGNRGGPGNPFARRTAALRQAFYEAITEEDMRAIAGELIVQARLGDKAAIKLVLAYVLGKPTAPADPDTLDVQEWQLWQQQTNIRAKDAAAINNGITAEMACTIARTTVPLVQQAEAAQMQANLMAGLDVPADALHLKETRDPNQAPAPARPSDGVPAPATALPADRQQTGKTASCHRQQTAETAAEFPFSEAEVAQATAWLIAACNGQSRHQTAETGPQPSAPPPNSRPPGARG